MLSTCSMLHDQMQHTRCDSVAAAHFVEHQPRPSFPSGLHYTTPDSHSLSSSSLTICLSFWHCAQWTFSQGRRPVTQLVVFRVSPFACPMHPAHLPSVTVLLPPPHPLTHSNGWVKTGDDVVAHKWNCQLITLANLLNVSKKELLLLLLGSFVWQLWRRRVGEASLLIFL